MIKYFLEIKNRLFLLFLLCFSFVLICYLYKEILLFFSIKYCILNSDLFYFIFTNVTEIFYVYFVIVNFINFQVFGWYFIYHLIAFFNPALFLNEYKYLNFFFKLFSCFFLFSFFFSNYLLIPLTWNFFLNFQSLSFSKSIYFEARLSEYIGFYKNVYCFCFIYCQTLSVLFFFLNDKRFNFSNVKIKKFRKLYYYIFIIFSTLLSPPEMITQMLTSLSLLFIYEFVLFFWLYFNFLIKLIGYKNKS